MKTERTIEEVENSEEMLLQAANFVSQRFPFDNTPSLLSAKITVVSENWRRRKTSDDAAECTNAKSDT